MGSLAEESQSGTHAGAGAGPIKRGRTFGFIGRNQLPGLVGAAFLQGDAAADGGSMSSL